VLHCGRPARRRSRQEKEEAAPEQPAEPEVVGVQHRKAAQIVKIYCGYFKMQRQFSGTSVVFAYQELGSWSHPFREGRQPVGAMLIGITGLTKPFVRGILGQLLSNIGPFCIL
jgi:hypothetical protein